MVKAYKYTEGEARRIGLKIQQKERQQDGYHYLGDVPFTQEEKPEFAGPINRVKARTPNQHKVIDLIERSDVSFVIGPAGSGKTNLAVGMADRYLADELCETVIICRPNVGVGRPMGHLPGTLEEKLAPFLRPIFDEYGYYRGKDQVRKMMAKEIIEIVSLEHIQGRTLRNAVIILDEAQNAIREELWMFLTRLGEGSKMILTGDPSQCMLSQYDQGGLQYFADLYRDVANMGVAYMSKRDIVRHPTVQTMITVREAYEAQSQ